MGQCTCFLTLREAPLQHSSMCRRPAKPAHTNQATHASHVVLSPSCRTASQRPTRTGRSGACRRSTSACWSSSCWRTGRGRCRWCAPPRCRHGTHRYGPGKRHSRRGSCRRSTPPRSSRRRSRCIRGGCQPGQQCPSRCSGRAIGSRSRSLRAEEGGCVGRERGQAQQQRRSWSAVGEQREVTGQHTCRQRSHAGQGCQLCVHTHAHSILAAGTHSRGGCPSTRAHCPASTAHMSRQLVGLYLQLHLWWTLSACNCADDSAHTFCMQAAGVGALDAETLLEHVQMHHR
jgi:hypothetical protein